MAKHFTIKIRVAYDLAHPIPEDMKDQLSRNIYNAINNDLLNDSNLEAVVEDWSASVEDTLV